MCTLWPQEGNDDLNYQIRYNMEYHRCNQHQGFPGIAFNWAKQLSLKRSLTFLKLMMEVNLDLFYKNYIIFIPFSKA